MMISVPKLTKKMYFGEMPARMLLVNIDSGAAEY
jgi:hypothetical protein